MNRHRLPPPSAFPGSARPWLGVPAAHHTPSLCTAHTWVPRYPNYPGGVVQGGQADSSCSLPAEPPFEAYPAVMGAATVGMLVATVASFLAVRCVARHRDALPRECWGQGGLSGGHGQTPGAHTSHPSVCPQGCTTCSSARECPNALGPVLPHPSAGETPLPALPQGRSWCPGAHRHARGC